MSYDPDTYTKADIPYEYSAIPNRIDEATWASYCDSQHPRWVKLARSWDPRLNTQWVVRHYLAVKTILGASLLLGSKAYCEEHNVRAALPYLTYYGLFNAARAWVFTMPGRDWGKNGQILTLSHETVNNVVVTEARHLDPALSVWIEPILQTARANRELFAYRFPTGGPTSIDIPHPRAILDVAQLFAELAQANSSMLNRALTKVHSGDSTKWAVDRTILRSAYEHTVAKGRVTMLDPEDQQRIAQITRHASFPWDLVTTARPGLLDDFFGAWLADSSEVEDDDNFDADDGNRILLHFN